MFICGKFGRSVRTAARTFYGSNPKCRVKHKYINDAGQY